MAKILIGRTLDSSTDSATVEQGVTSTPWSVAEQNVLVPEQYDYIELVHTNSLLTSAVYKLGGVAGTTVASLALTYDIDGNIETVTRT
jgi:hypothetical protein